MHINDQWIYEHLSADIESAIKLGWNRAHKHTDTPEPDEILAVITHEVMNVLAECLAFDTSP